MIVWLRLVLGSRFLSIIPPVELAARLVHYQTDRYRLLACRSFSPSVKSHKPHLRYTCLLLPVLSPYAPRPLATRSEQNVRSLDINLALDSGSMPAHTVTATICLRAILKHSHHFHQCGPNVTLLDRLLHLQSV